MTTAELKAATKAIKAASKARMDAMVASHVQDIKAMDTRNAGLRAEVASMEGRLKTAKAGFKAIERGLAQEDRRNG